MIKIVIADDHNLFSETLASSLVNDNSNLFIKSVSNGKDLIEHLNQFEADVVLLDINMPIMDGIDASKYILKNFPACKVIMLTMLDKPIIIEKMIEIGVHGYLLKNTSKSELLMAIEAVMSGQLFFSPEVTLKILAQKNKLKHDATHLTKREREIIGLICEGLTTVEIAEKLFLSKFTVDSHRKNIVSKTECKNAAQLQNWARKNDLIP